MIPRYQTPFMQSIWCEQTKYATWYAVEVAYLASYLEAHGTPDQNLINRLEKQAQQIDWNAFAVMVEQNDRETRHDVIAFLQALETVLGPDSRLIHLGLTSSDIVDTSFAILLKKSCVEIEKKLAQLVHTLWKKAHAHRGEKCLGRTHGQAAEPTTFGIKLLSHVCEFARSHARLREVTREIAVGKFSGAVGTFGQTEPHVERLALSKLDLLPETVATQVVARDRHAALMATLAVLAGSIERLAVEIRLLMHGQVKEVFEPFHAKQKGSSAMPHKKNPVLSENLTGLARMVRSYSLAILENQALWHERDISHSSVERVVVPDAFHLIDFALTRLTGLVEALVVDEERMSANLAEAGEILCSQSVMLALVKKGLLRKEAYELVQRAALSGTRFSDGLVAAGVLEYMTKEELSAMFSNTNLVKYEDVLFERAQEIVGTV